MPALPAVPKVLKVTMPFAYPPSNTALNRIFIQYGGTGPTPAQLSTYCDQISAAWNADLAAMVNTLVTAFPVQAEDLTTSSSAIGVGTTSHAGTRAGQQLPASVCCDMEFKIARRYRGGKPRAALPFGVASDVFSTGVWLNAFLSAAITQWNLFMTAVLTGTNWPAAGTLTHVNVSYYAGNTPVQNPITHRWRNVPNPRGAPVVDPIIGYTPENGIGSQRRRNVI